MSLSTRIGRPVAIRIWIVHSCIEQRLKAHNRKNYVTTRINSNINDVIFMFRHTSLFYDKHNVNAIGKSSADARARACVGGWVSEFTFLYYMHQNFKFFENTGLMTAYSGRN